MIKEKRITSNSPLARGILTWFVTVMLFQLPLLAVNITTFYGPIAINEPVLLELIESPAFQRLKHIHQYGVVYYTTQCEEYTRYDHSLGVLAILKGKNASLEEQVAGLLHDVSHTIFSHVGDWIFGMEFLEKDYQNSIHGQFLIRSGLGAILSKYDLTVDQVLPLEELFPMLEQKGPDLCADRIDYNIQGAFHKGFITYEEAMEIYQDLQFVEGCWVSSRPDLMEKLGRSSLALTQHCWGGVANYLLSSWLAKAIVRAVEIGEFSEDDIHYGTDQVAWGRLQQSQDNLIQTNMKMLSHVDDFFCALDDPNEADLIVMSKFRGIDPWILTEGEKVRLTTFNAHYREQYVKVKRKLQKGEPIKLIEPVFVAEFD